MLMLATPPLQAALPRRALEFAPSQDVCVNPSVYTSKTFFNDPTCSTTIPCYEEGFDQDLRQAGYTITADRMMNIYNRLVTNTPCFEMTTELNILGCKDMDSLIEANNETWTDYPIVRTCCYPNRYGLVTNISGRWVLHFNPGMRGRHGRAHGQRDSENDPAHRPVRSG